MITKKEVGILCTKLFRGENVAIAGWLLGRVISERYFGDKTIKEFLELGFDFEAIHCRIVNLSDEQFERMRSLGAFPWTDLVMAMRYVSDSPSSDHVTVYAELSYGPFDGISTSLNLKESPAIGTVFDIVRRTERHKYRLKDCDRNRRLQRTSWDVGAAILEFVRDEELMHVIE